MARGIPHRLDIGKSRLRALISGAEETRPRLPLVHSTDCYALDDILADEEIVPQSCKVFSGEALTYFFYGRPAFRPNSDAEPTSLKHYFPVCLIFKPNWIAPIKRIFPFDSGAHQDGLYNAYLHDRMKLGDFGLEPDISTPGRLISHFFGDNSAYLRGAPITTPKFDPSEFEASSYSAIIHARESNAIDNRGSAIEVQADEKIPLRNAVAAIVLPSTFVDGRFATRMRKNKIAALPYKTFERSRPSEYTSQITTICFQFYIHLKILNEGDI